MAAMSPVSSSKGGDSTVTAPNLNGNETPQRTTAFDMPKPNQRGLNKPKCIKCGNVARSRCPFQCCKSCCYKAQNPCHIHVLKQSSTLPDKAPASSSSLEQQMNDSTSTGSSWRLNSLKQLSTNILNSLRAKKTLSKKDIALTNKWRFMKLREHIQSNIQSETEAFDRYIKNIGLLEEIFSLTDSSKPETKSLEDLVSKTKLRLRSNIERESASRERLTNMLDQKLKELSERENDNNNEEIKLIKGEFNKRLGKTEAVSDLVDKLNNARGEEDLKSCFEIGAQIFNLSNDFGSEGKIRSNCYYPEICPGIQVDQELIYKIDEEFKSLNQQIVLL